MTWRTAGKDVWTCRGHLHNRLQSSNATLEEGHRDSKWLADMLGAHIDFEAVDLIETVQNTLEEYRGDSSFDKLCQDCGHSNSAMQH